MENKVSVANEVIQQIKHILVDDMQVRVAFEDIPDDYSLLESGLALDSILIAELIARIEDRFGFQFDERVMNTELFVNLSLLADFVVEVHLAAKRNVQVGQSAEATC